MEEHLQSFRETPDSDSSDYSSVSSRYSSEGEVPLPTYDDLSEPDDPAPGFQTSGDAVQSSIVSITEQRQLLRVLSAKKPVFGIFPTTIEATLNANYANIVQRLKELPDRECTVVIAGGSLLKMMDPSWEGRVPASVLCDACVFSPTQPVMVLTFTGKNGKTTTKYNTSLATLIIEHVKKDTKFDFNVVHATVENLLSQEKHSFLTRINKRENSARSIHFPTELHMDKDKCTAVMKSFLKHLSRGTESEKLSLSLEDKAHEPTMVKQHFKEAEESQHLFRRIEAVYEDTYQRDKAEEDLLKYLTDQQWKLEKDSPPQFTNVSQDKTSELQQLDADARTLSTRDIFPRCSVCKQKFILNGPAPYLLPCLHAVCETCVTSAASGVISCSTCQREVNLTDTSLQKDAVRQNEIFHLTVKHRPTELLCTHEDDSNQAVCWCQDCKELLCEYCQNMHSSVKVFRRHVLQNFGDMVPTASNNPTYCSIHKHHSLYLFDKSCQKLICSRCRLGDHAHHDVGELDVVADAVTKQLYHHKNVLSMLLDRQQLHMQCVRQGRDSIRWTHRIWNETIGHTFQILRLQLDESEKEFITYLESQTKEADAMHHDLVTTYEGHWETCTRVLDYIDKAFLYGSKLDLLVLECYVRDMTQACQDTATPETHNIPPALCNSNRMSKLKSITSGFCTLLTRQSAKDVDTQTDDFMAEIELKHRIDIEELKMKTSSHEEHIKTLEDQCSAEIRSLQSVIEELKTKTDSDEKRMESLTDVSNAEKRRLQSVIEELKTKSDSDEKRIESLTDESNAEKRHLQSVIGELKTKTNSDEKRIKRLTDESSAEIRCLQSRIKEKELIEERASTTIDFLLSVAGECAVHKLKPGALDISMILKCIPLKYDKHRVNLDKAHINTEGDLENRKSGYRPAGEGRLKKYWGTCNTFPLPRDGCPQYWEVENRVSLDKPLSGNWLILEVGVCREQQRDVSYCIGRRSHSYGMTVQHCTTHGGICRVIWKEGENALCLPDTIPNTAGTSHTLHYGVVFDDASEKIVFIDVKEKKVMSTLDNVDCSEPLWPMFGVYNPHCLTASMRLVVGSDINMTEEKKAMIVKALS